ncbi:MAG: Serine-tRNA ligase [Candidatus Moranbacteria bacterium GW2011_GWE1_35_17]|nr:MAG: Serine-tRNA ligase [Candidatus Moranbacteria bacterium GW2011_GWE2_35_164]KKP67365.1 MAG: Serine-tRNA ligase [Candidatus Moranbacteria bacterium GW2011_GWE1_35_17]KKP80996.1 MAG: Serine-tRNA ligase [Candidatus Moranbacteria bacterium GW2011_GWF1_35_5]KKP81939.1 MAG: Serine-tRNA ligase [Candidatus Moranbacteria bacterium GW2011_GWF2_35_54]
MLDIKFIKENKEAVAEAAKNKNIKLDFEKLLELDAKRVELLQEIEKLQAQKNEINNEIAKADDKAQVIARGTKIKEELAQLEPEFKKIKDAFESLMVQVPNVVSADTPIAKDESGNEEILIFGEIPKFDFPVKNHIELGKDLDILDLEKGAKVAGYRGYYLKNEGATLAMALMMYALNKMIEKGYVPMIPPTLVKGSALFGTGYFSGKEYNSKEDNIYQLASADEEVDGALSKEKRFLVGTAEPSLLAYYADDVLKEEDLPIKVAGYSQCYRSEIGSYGKDTKGFYRVHEFMKVEQVVLMKADDEASVKMHEDMFAISKEIHEELGLPYRVLKICTGDMSAGKFRAYDIEAWMPGLNRWGETGSASNFTDWQARRLNTKYIDKDGKKKFVYMLNNTVLPSARPFIAILENFQQADGSVVIPEVLRKWMPGNIDRISKK